MLFFTPIENSILLALIVVLALLSLLFAGGCETPLPRSQLLLLIAIAIAVLVSVGLSPYSTVMSISMAASVFALFVFFPFGGVEENERLTHAFLWVCTLILALTFVVYVARPDFFEHFGGVYRPGRAAWTPLLYGANDKNRTALFVFLFACLCWKKQFKPGIVLALVYPFLYFGRQYIFMIGIVIALWIAYAMIERRKGPGSVSATMISPMKLFAAFVLATILVGSFSYYWTSEVSSAGVGTYKTTLNDRSNATRMASTVYALERIDSELGSFLFYGYDTDVFDELGISSSDFSAEANYYIGGIYRLVQPHEEVINTLLKEGLIFTILYYLAVSTLLCGIVRSRQDFIILAAFFVGSLFLHQMFTMQNLIMLCIVLKSAPTWNLGESASLAIGFRQALASPGTKA